VSARPPLVTLRATDPPMGESDGNGPLIRLVQERWKVLEVDGVYGPRTRNAVASWQWRVGAPNFRGAITPQELLVLLEYRERPEEWVARAKARAGKPSPHEPEKVTARASVEYVPLESWCPIPPRGQFSFAPHPEGVPHVVHWFGHGAPAATIDGQINQCVGFAREHMRRGYVGVAYNFILLTNGLCLVGRGLRARSAATGSNLGNTYPSVLVMCGTEAPAPTIDQLDSLKAMRHEHGWGRRLCHHELSPTACPGPDLTAWVNANR